VLLLPRRTGMRTEDCEPLSCVERFLCVRWEDLQSFFPQSKLRQENFKLTSKCICNQVKIAVRKVMNERTVHLQH
jgi:hypothetical protein